MSRDRGSSEGADLGSVLEAMAFAAQKHRDQRRKDREASPYINHPIDLANILVNEAGVTDAVTVVAAILHDTVEDTDTSVDELGARFGAEVTAIVAEVTDDKTLPKAERKRMQEVHAPTASFRAQQVKLADKISNLRDIVRSPPETWSLERRRDYFEWAKRVADGVRGRHARLEELFDQAYQAKP
jgi:guanosine-3',5'-bis(diphosphate) 3'-pyrophosphohydrolase